MIRKKIVAGNWKMNKTYDESLALVSEVKNIIKSEVNNGCLVVLCVPYPFLYPVGKMLEGSNIALGAQNCHEKEKGAYTGEVSALMLNSVGVKYVIIGHSERREYFKENNLQLAEKINVALKYGLTPIFCCGESLWQREQNLHISFVKSQLEESLFHLTEKEFRKIVIAYEPIWAIGTGVTASTTQAQEMHVEIRNYIASKYGTDVAQQVSILYGGSCKPDNARELFACPDIDGGLIGGASLKARDFADIIKSL